MSQLSSQHPSYPLPRLKLGSSCVLVCVCLQGGRSVAVQWAEKPTPYRFKRTGDNSSTQRPYSEPLRAETE
ncbi:hypothetical protein AALO_G00039600 [Alosa alosa]|uniref:Secreted protein n=1 Tax=Alosa alosa TaxID=278164 RepID=A0AAV6HCK7_9TELE|nr:hypothetical protein AALO_G00039600 [Alosa alosa]